MDNDIFKLRQVGDYGHDGAEYEVTMLRACSIAEFIKVILFTRTDEWGKIEILNTEQYTKNRDKNISVEYRYGSLVEDSIEEYWKPAFASKLAAKIKSVSAFGGYSAMDYKIELCDEAFLKEDNNEMV